MADIRLIQSKVTPIRKNIHLFLIRRDTIDFLTERISNGGAVDNASRTVSSAYQRVQPEKDIASMSERER